MSERLAKLEAAVDGLRHSQNLTLGSVVAFGAIAATLLVYIFTRVDQLSDRIAAIPGQIAAENRDIVKTLSDAITATKQQVPQVIFMPAPAAPASSPPAANPSPEKIPVSFFAALAFEGAELTPAGRRAIDSAISKVAPGTTLYVRALSDPSASAALLAAKIAGVKRYLVDQGWSGPIEVLPASSRTGQSVELLLANQ